MPPIPSLLYTTVYEECFGHSGQHMYQTVNLHLLSFAEDHHHQHPPRMRRLGQQIVTADPACTAVSAPYADEHSSIFVASVPNKYPEDRSVNIMRVRSRFGEEAVTSGSPPEPLSTCQFSGFHKSSICAIAFSPPAPSSDAVLLASVDQTGAFFVSSVSNGSQPARPVADFNSRFKSPISCLSWSKTADFLVSAHDSFATVWDVEREAAVQRLDRFDPGAGSGQVSSIDCSPEAPGLPALIAAASARSKSAFIFDTRCANGGRLFPPRNNNNFPSTFSANVNVDVNHVKFSADGRILFDGSMDGTVGAFDVRGGKSLFEEEDGDLGADDRVSGLATSASCPNVVAFAGCEEISVCHAATKRCFPLGGRCGGFPFEIEFGEALVNLQFVE